MPRKSKYAGTVVDIPSNVSVDPKGYVYYNVTSEVRHSIDGKKYNDHKKVLIGKVLPDSPDWKTDRRMTPNDNYFALLAQPSRDNLPDPPDHADHIAVGLHVAIQALAEKSGLDVDLFAAFGGYDDLLLDFAQFMLSNWSAEGLRLPAWARNHATSRYWDPEDWNDMEEFLTHSVDHDSFRMFQSRWTSRNIGDGKVFFCCDAIYSDCTLDGVWVLESGEVLDEAPFDTIYLLRQSDGMPLAFLDSPGCGRWFSGADEITDFLEGLLKSGGSRRKLQPSDITFLCGKGRLTQDQLEDLDQAGIPFLLRLLHGTEAAEVHIRPNISGAAAYEQELLRQKIETITETGPLLDGEETTRQFHIVWESLAAYQDKKRLDSDLKRSQKKLQSYVKDGDLITDEQIREYMPFWDMALQTDSSSFQGDQVWYRITSFQWNQAQIEREAKKCGYRVMVSSEQMTAQEAQEAFEKPLCLKAVLAEIQYDLREDEPGLYAFLMQRVKTVACLIAAILYTLIHNKTEALRREDPEKYSVSSIICYLDEIVADYNLTKECYERRYALTEEQSKILHALGIPVKDIDSFIQQMER